jgi:hypothetical protein
MKSAIAAALPQAPGATTPATRSASAHLGLGHVVTSVEAPRARLDVRQMDGLQKV